MRLGRLMQLVVVVATVVMTARAAAQIRTIPQQLRDSVANPPTVANQPLRFDSEELHFGTIAEDGGLWQGRLGFVNEGDAPIVITRVVTTCGCLRASFDRSPLAPKRCSELQVSYNPKGHPGVVYQRLFLYTNLSASRPTAILSLKGAVEQAADKSSSYPIAHGALRLRTDQVRLSTLRDEGEVRIACRNAGDRALCIELDELLSSRCFSLRTEPATIAPEAEGELVIEYRHSEGEQGVPRLYWKGIALPPRERMIRVTAQ